jgi:hypothetical protein
MQEVRYTELQDSMPTFIRRPDGLTWKGRHYPKGTEFPWKTIGVTFDQARNLFHASQIYHSDILTAENKVGDGLGLLDIDQLHEVVERINTKVKLITKDNKKAYQTKKCKQSTVVDKQRGLIRSWRRNFGHIENS